MSDFNDLSVGQTVYFTDVNRPGLSETKVTKVGHKLIHTPFSKFYKENGSESGNYNHKQLFISKEKYFDMKDINLIHDALRRKTISNNISLETIKIAIAMLGIEVKFSQRD